MRVKKVLYGNHNNLQGQTPHDHHPQGTAVEVLVNSQAIPASSAWELALDLGREGYETMRVILRGQQNVDIQGHTGCSVVGSSSAGSCMAISIRPYGTGYTTSYMGGYSRLHGDSYLTHIIFGSYSVLRDVWIDGSDAVLEFYNPNPSIADSISVYGMVVVK